MPWSLEPGSLCCLSLPLAPSRYKLSWYLWPTDHAVIMQAFTIKRIRLPNVICWHDMTALAWCISACLSLRCPPVTAPALLTLAEVTWSAGPGSPRNMGSGSPQPSAATKSSHTVGQEKKSSRAIAVEITILLTFTVPDPLFQTTILSSMSMPSLTVCI